MKTFNDFWKSLDTQGRIDFAAKADTSIPYLCNLVAGRKGLGLSLYFRLLKADSRITHEMLQPLIKDAA